MVSHAVGVHLGAGFQFRCESSWEGQKESVYALELVGDEGAPLTSHICQRSSPMESLEHSQILFGSPRAPSMELLVIFFVFSPQARFFQN